MRFFSVLTLFLCLYSLPLSARVVLPSLFTDNMVLQQQTNAPLWGKAQPRKAVTVQASWTQQAYTATADEQGAWRLALPTPAAGGPYTLTFSDGAKLTLRNVMVGEVWLCSGQSNMEMPLAGWGKISNYEQEIANANYPNIRLLHVAKATSLAPQSDIRVEGGWQVCSPATIAEFSSTAYFFGRDLLQSLNVPIGLINSTWGGTPAEAWTSAESLSEMPDFRNYLATLKGRSATDIMQEYEKNLATWNSTVALADSSSAEGTPLWASPSFNDEAWQTMPLPALWENTALPNFDGVVWLRYTVDIPAALAGKELLLSLAEVDDNDITYFNGVQVGKTEGYNLFRRYKIPAKLVKRGKNIIALRVTDTGGGGGVYGSATDLSLSVSSSKKSQVEKISLAANWKYKATVDFNKLPPRPQSPNNASNPSALYNGMIHPLVPFAIKGAIWYQGEANASRAKQYRDLFPLMVLDWRKQWNADFPFYFVQLAGYAAQPADEDWAMLREAQLHALHLSNTGMAVATDIGDAKDIHPKNKQEVGVRLALLARANTYGQQIVSSGPLYKNYKVESGAIRISFSHTDGGLRAKSGAQLKGFTIAGADHKFYEATATIVGDEVVVSAPQVAFPLAVRYAWENDPEAANLCNAAGLPASPFRTDEY